MKHLRSLTKKQKMFLSAKHLNAENWLLERDTPYVMVVVHKYDNTIKIEIHKKSII